MPVCVNCAHPAEHLYTTYRTKSNIRLGVCQRCDSFLDPLIEHPDLLILLDLVLLKPRVYLHLMFNRGSEPLSAHQILAPASVTTSLRKDGAGHTADGHDAAEGTRRRQRKRLELLRGDLARLSLVTVLAETAVRLLPLLSDGTGKIGKVGPGRVMRTVGVALLGLLAQHCVTLTLGLAALWPRGWYPPARRKVDASRRDGRQENFLPILIPLTVMYTSILPLLLQLIISIWYSPHSIHEHLPSTSSSLLPPVGGSIPPSILSLIPEGLRGEAQILLHALSSAWVGTDRVWAGTRLLGGMSAGFGLRVVLPTRPWETTGIVLAGWGAAALAEAAAEQVFAVR